MLQRLRAFQIKYGSMAKIMDTPIHNSCMSAMPGKNCIVRNVRTVNNDNTNALTNRLDTRKANLISYLMTLFLIATNRRTKL